MAGRGGIERDGATRGPAIPAGGKDCVRAVVRRGIRGPLVLRESSSGGALVVKSCGR